MKELYKPLIIILTVLATTIIKNYGTFSLHNHFKDIKLDIPDMVDSFANNAKRKMSLVNVVSEDF